MANEILDAASDKPSTPTNSEKVGWRLDRNIPVAILIAILLQAFVFVFLIGTNAEKIAEHDKRFDKLDIYVQEHTKTLADLSNHIASLDAKMTILLDEVKDLRHAAAPTTAHK